MADAPTVKPWGNDDKKKLQQLIDGGKVDISRTEDINYIDSVRFKYYHKHGNVNFHCNFWNYAHSIDIEEHYQGYHTCLAAGGIVYCRVRLLFYYLSNNCHPVRSLNHRGRQQLRADRQRRGVQRHRHHGQQGGRQEQASHDSKNEQEEEQVEFIGKEGQSQGGWR